MGLFMSASSRLTEKWINRGLWVISFVFAGFLIGLGSLVVADLPRVQDAPKMEDFVDHAQYDGLKVTIEQKEKVVANARKELNSEYEKLGVLQNNYYKSKENFNNWLSTRQTTQDNTQNNEVLTRTKELEKQQDGISKFEEKLREKESEIQKLEGDTAEFRNKLSDLESEAYKKVDEVYRWNQVKVFGLRLALTLPLLLIAAWLFAKKRKTKNWPFVWGFVFFALFAFFVELVPYLPSYGGYIRYVVGIVGTFFIGQYSIKALQNYLEKQKQAEAMPSNQIKEKLNYELAHQRLSRSICPGCERPIDLKDTTRNYCMHCGTCVYNNCTQCNTRKNAFAKFCHSCGAAG